MGDFRKGGGKRFGGRGGGFGGQSGGRGRSGGGRDFGPVSMHQAICDQCKKPCEVPFKPSGDKPVYCNTCFGSRRDAENRGGDRFAQKNYESHAPFARQSGGDGGGAKDGGELKKQLELLNTKMDRLIKVAEMVAAHALPQTPSVAKVKKTTKKVSKK